MREMLLQLNPPIVHLFLADAPLVLFLVLFIEEAGIPLPIPGDAFLLYAGVLVAEGKLNVVAAVVSVVAGVVCGSSILYTLVRHYGRPFLQRYGAVFGVNEQRLAAVERLVERWGPFAIIFGRHIPGMRIAVTVFAGLFEDSYPVFVLSVGVSALLWAALFLTIGARVGRKALALLQLHPMHFLSIVGVLLMVTGIVVLLWRLHTLERREEAKAARQSPAA